MVLVPFPFTDLTMTKLRPAVVLLIDSSGIDVTVCFVSSQNLGTLTPEEFLITSNHPEFSQTGLKLDSKVRVSRIITIERSLIVRKIGYLDINLSYQLNQCLKQAFQL